MSQIVGGNVERVRELLHLTQQELAERVTAEVFAVRMDRSAVSRIESGERGVSVTEVAALARALEAPAVELLRTDAHIQDVSPQRLFQLWTGIRVESWPDWSPAPYSVITEARRAVERIAHERAVRRAAARLQATAGDLEAVTTPHTVAQACWDLWGHGLEEERDRRAAAAEARGRTRRAVRALVTPELLDEIRERIAWAFHIPSETSERGDES